MPAPDSEPIRVRRRRWAAVVVILVLLAGGAYWFLGRTPGGAGRNGGFGAMGAMKVPVKIAAAESTPFDVIYTAIGTVTANNTVTVRSRVDGELQKIFFKDGQKVAEGDLLAQIDPRPFQVQLDQALGQQKQNQAQLENARRDLQRYQLLYKQNSIARQQVDTQEALVQQYLGSQKSDQAAVDSARLQLTYTRITAPLSGRLGLRNVDQGNLISSSSTDGLVVITQTQPILAVFTLPQTQLARVLGPLRAGKRLRVDLYDRGDTARLATGELLSVDNQIDVATGTVKFKAQFANEDESLFPNQFVNVRLFVDTLQNATVIPTAAIQQGSIGAFVYVIDENGVAHVRRIQTGPVNEGRMAVSGGLTPGERIVTEGVDRLREGAEVEVVTPESEAEVAKKAAAAAARQAAPGPRGRRPQ